MGALSLALVMLGSVLLANGPLTFNRFLKTLAMTFLIFLVWGLLLNQFPQLYFPEQ